MSRLSNLRAQWRSLFHREEVEAELQEELQFHVEMETAENLRRGMTAEQARQAAERRFGRADRFKEECRDQRGVAALEHLGQNLRFALRLLGKHPGFAAVAVLTLALGIGANTTVFSLVNALLLRPPAVPQSSRLVELWQQPEHRSPGPGSSRPLSYPDFAYFRDHNHVFTGLMAFATERQSLNWNRQGNGQDVEATMVTSNYFAVLHLRPALGSFFDPAGSDTAPRPAVVLRHAFWQQQLGADPNVIGQTLDLNGRSFEVIGVAPARFDGLLAGAVPDVWMPLQALPAAGPIAARQAMTERRMSWLMAVGRLQPQVSQPQAQAEITVLSEQLARAFPATNRDLRTRLFAATLLPGPFRTIAGGFSGILMVVVGLVLLIACANAANLLLGQAARRSRELAVRAALGASRGRLMRQMLTEGVLMALMAGGLGLLLAWRLAPLVLLLQPPGLAMHLEVGVDLRVLAFTLALSLLTGILFSLPPALQSSRFRLAARLQENPQTAGERSRLRRALVVVQVAVCVVVLIGAGLCLRSLWRARTLNPGFDPSHALTADLNLSAVGYSEAQARGFDQRLLTRLRQLPGVTSAALADNLPLGPRQMDLAVERPGQAAGSPRDLLLAGQISASPEYFRAMHTGLLEGRDFTDRDDAEAPPVVIINQELARRLWPGADPIGQTLVTRVGTATQSLTVVGVAQTGKYVTLGESPQPFFFRPLAQAYRADHLLVIRSSGGAEAMLAPVRDAIHAEDGRLVFNQLETLRGYMELPLFPARLAGTLLGAFGILALLLAVVGLYGVVAYSVVQRTREIGVRVALGAAPGDVVSLVLGQGLRLVGLGLGIGLLLALVVSRALASILFGIGALDPVTFAGVPLLLVLVALAASWLPARRAARVSPLTALRGD